MAGPGASGPAGRARCPDTIIDLASAEVYGAGGGAGPGRASSIESTRVYLHLTSDWLAGEYRRAAALIDADAAAVAEMLAVQEAVVR